MTLLPAILLLLGQISAAPKIHSAAASSGAEQVHVVLFTDFQCPYCAELAPAFRELEARGVEGVETTIELRHFPLNIHPAARLAHQAALAAARQGKFWEMHDLLFANRSAAKRDDLLQYAARLGLDLKRFVKDLDSEAVKQQLDTDIAEGDRLHVEGTPTIFVNGKPYTGAKSLDQLRAIVRRAQQRMRVMSEVPDERLSRGPSDAPVTVELFADLESPVTVPALAILDQVMRSYPSKVRIQFRSFPLAFHPQAPLAHEAAMAAASQGRFWEFAKYILEHQNSLREQDLISEAGRLGIDQTKFAASLEQHKYSVRVDSDIEAGRALGIRGSPVVLVDGKRIDGVPTLQRLVELVETKLGASGQK